MLTYNNNANLQTGALSALETDEQGRSLAVTSYPYFWTGMSDDASTSTIGTCTSWTVSTGDGSVGSFTELNRGNGSIGLPFSCGNSQRLLCLEQ